MVLEIEVTKRYLRQEGGTFNVAAIYKVTKKVAESAGYMFIEGEHRSKPEKLGHLYEFGFQLGHQFDYFAQDEITLFFVFEDIKRVKKNGNMLEYGTGKLKMETKLVLDYQNKWGTSALNKFLFTIYHKYLILQRIKKKYVASSVQFTDKLYTALKDEFERYQ